MKRLSEDLKRMLNALALQDAAENLPLRGKLAALGIRGGEVEASPAPHDTPPPPRRVALLSDGTDIEGILDYTLDACQRQQATLDLVLYGAAKASAERMRGLLQRRGIAHELIMLGEENVDALAEYIYTRRSLVYLVAPADDRLAMELTEELLPSRGNRLHLPMVLVERQLQAHPRINRINAA